MNFLRKGYRKLSSDRQTDRQTRPKLYTTSLREWSIIHTAVCQAIDVKFSQDLTHQRSLKSVNFWQSYLKNEKVDVVFGTQCIFVLWSLQWGENGGIFQPISLLGWWTLNRCKRD